MSLFDNNDILADKAYQNALRLLDYSPQTEKMISDKLKKKGYNEEIIVYTIKKLKENGLLNDTEYAKILSDNLCKFKFLGKEKIKIKLLNKGINKDNIEKIIDEAINNNGGEEKIAINFIIKNSLTIKRLLEKNQLEKIKIKLFNNGFSVPIIYKITKNLNDIIKNI